MGDDEDRVLKGAPDTPDLPDVVDVGETSVDQAAVQLFIKTVFEELMAAHWQSLYEQQMVEEHLSEQANMIFRINSGQC